MPLTIRNSLALVDPAKFRFKVLVYGLSGSGKTSWMASAPNIGVIAAETGIGNGLLSVAQNNVDFVVPSNLPELEAITNGAVFRDKPTLGLDSISWMSKSFIKDAALAIPRGKGDTQKRSQGVPELDDYQVMSEITRRLLAKLLDKEQNLIVCATEKDITNESTGETLYVPDLPGALALTCTAMFDFVFRLRTRQQFRDRRDPNSRYIERYLITQSDGKGTLAKCRSNEAGKPLLDPEEPFELDGKGTFTYLFDKIINGYKSKEK